MSIVFDFATSEPCTTGAPPRMKIGLSMIFRVYQEIFQGVFLKDGEPISNQTLGEKHVQQFLQDSGQGSPSPLTGEVFSPNV